jgi:pyridoxine 5-phosphate synthase
MRLYINIDHVATVRQARRGLEPDPVAAAAIAEDAGADGITVHLREDRRHIQDHDVERLLPKVRTLVNLEMAVADEIVEKALAWKPHQATLVPERREEVTTEGGLDCSPKNRKKLGHVLGRLKAAGIRTSLFITSDPESLEAAIALRPDAVEFHTGRWSRVWKREEQADEIIGELAAATARAREAGLAVHAGHGLNYDNVGPVARLRGIEELNIGHSIVSFAVLHGMDKAVREMRLRIDQARGNS